VRRASAPHSRFNTSVYSRIFSTEHNSFGRSAIAALQGPSKPWFKKGVLMSLPSVSISLAFRSLVTVTVLLTGLSHAQADGATLPGSNQAPAPVNKCAEISKSLDQVYQNLYNVDTRPLTIDSYRSYRDSIQILHDQIALLQNLCNGAVPPASQQTLYKTKDYSWNGPASYTNTCGSTDLSGAKAEFQETSIRECFSAGYSDCSTKLPSRAFAVSGSQKNDLTWVCTAKFDLVLNVAK